MNFSYSGYFDLIITGYVNVFLPEIMEYFYIFTPIFL